MAKRILWLKRVLICLLLVGVLAEIAAEFYGVGVYHVFFKKDDLPDIEKLSQLKLNSTSLVYSAKSEITGRFFYEIRDPVKLKDVPQLVKNSFLAAEDKRFFSHIGVDPVAIVRAATHNYLSKRVVSGASTITQQLVRLLYEDEVLEFKRRDMTKERKIKEARLAIQLEKRYTKEEILEAYLNYVYLGHSRYGIAEASRFYFSKELSELDPAEAAMIAALNKFPSKFDPIKKPQAALERRNLVLLLMKESRFISKSEYQHYRQEPIKTKISKTDFDFGYANDFVRRVLLKKGYNTDQIWYGGLRIKTTIVSRIQKIAIEVLQSQLAKLNQEFGGPYQLEGSVVVIQNGIGKIAAIVGGHDFQVTKYNRAVQRSAARQPGSAFKIFTYAAALENGMGFEDSICDCPIRLPGKINFYGKVIKWWQPRNFHEKSHPDFMGPIPLWKGIVLSRNVATINLARKQRISTVIQTAHDMGIQTKLSPYLPTAIGASDVGLLELTAAYSDFPNLGVYREPYIISEIADSKGQNLYKAEPEVRRALSEKTAEDMTVLLRAVTEIGTAKVTFKGIVQKVAGKTGTTNDSRDVLFFGFTPGPNGYTIGVRIGYDIPRSLGERQTGGLLAAPVCRQIIEGIYKDKPSESFSKEIEGKLQKLIGPK